MSKQRVKSVEDEELAQGVPLISESDINALADDDDSKANKTSYGFKSVCYAATISLILSLACFGLASTFGRREDERPIQLFEKESAKAAAERSPITETMEYKSRPYMASFLDKDLYLVRKLCLAIHFITHRHHYFYILFYHSLYLLLQYAD